MNANALDNLQRLLPEFYKAIGQTFVMVGVSAAFAVVIGGALGVWLFASAPGQVSPAPASTASSARWSALCAPFPSSSS